MGNKNEDVQDIPQEKEGEEMWLYARTSTG